MTGHYPELAIGDEVEIGVNTYEIDEFEDTARDEDEGVYYLKRIDVMKKNVGRLVLAPEGAMTDEWKELEQWPAYSDETVESFRTETLEAALWVANLIDSGCIPKTQLLRIESIVGAEKAGIIAEALGHLQENSDD